MDRLNDILKQRLAAGQMTQSEHPSADTLTAFAEQNLKAPQREAILEHLAACADCRQTVMMAASEIPVEQAAADLGRNSVFQFPAAMRWASLAAAVAVAVGVGLLLNEHESAPRPSQSIETIQPTKAPPSTQPAPEAAKPQPEAKNLKATNDLLEPSAAKQPTSSSQKKLTLATGRDRVNSSTAAANVAASPRVPSAANTDQLSVYANLNQAKANSPVSSRDLDQSAAPNAGNVFKPAEPPPAAASAFANQPQDTSVNGRMVQTQTSPAGAAQSVQMGDGRPVSEQAQTVQIPYSKSAPGAAVGGPLRRAQSTFHGGIVSGGIVSWAISDTGQLQRMVTDGATTGVQPAPGMTVRAVAAEGIEVWAAGAQADPSAKEWTQRSVLFHSSDAGKTWSRVDGPWQSAITQLSLSGKGNLVVTTQNGVWVTNDAGKTWVPVKTKG